MQVRGHLNSLFKPWSAQVRRTNSFNAVQPNSPQLEFASHKAHRQRSDCFLSITSLVFARGLGRAQTSDTSTQTKWRKCIGVREARVINRQPRVKLTLVLARGSKEGLRLVSTVELHSAGSAFMHTRLSTRQPIFMLRDPPQSRIGTSPVGMHWPHARSKYNGDFAKAAAINWLSASPHRKAFCSFPLATCSPPQYAGSVTSTRPHVGAALAAAYAHVV